MKHLGEINEFWYVRGIFPMLVSKLLPSLGNKYIFC